MEHANDRQPTRTPQYVLAALIIGMAVTAALLITRIPPFFGPDGGDPAAAGVLASFFVVFTVGARIVRPAAMK